MKKRFWIVSVTALCGLAFVGWFFVCQPNSIITDPDINGLGPDQVISKFGKPDRTEIFILSDTMIEYRYGLLLAFPRYRDSSVEIMEMFWSSSSRSLAVWFTMHSGTWVVVDNLRWGKNIQF